MIMLGELKSHAWSAYHILSKAFFSALHSEMFLSSVKEMLKLTKNTKMERNTNVSENRNKIQNKYEDGKLDWW